MRELPILFADEMVRALLEGRKTQTRRLINPQPNFTPEDIELLTGLRPGLPLADIVTGAWRDGFVKARCPYGGPGTRLWVREAWCCDHCYERDFDTTRRTYVGKTLTDAECIAEWRGNNDSNLYYRADGQPDFEGERPTWTPSIHMPRWASRLLLEVVDIRVQRLQDITEEDAVAEGARRFPDLPHGRIPHEARWSLESPTDTGQCLGSARMAFANYVNTLHGGRLWNCKPTPSLWDTNPWVWAVSFRPVEGSR